MRAVLVEQRRAAAEPSLAVRLRRAIQRLVLAEVDAAYLSGVYCKDERACIAANQYEAQMAVERLLQEVA